MILHRLRLNNFRGVAEREIRFPDHGVVVVHGPNEIGKSSMLEALGLLLNYKDRSNHRDVKQVKPTHADVGAMVEAEITTGRYRFVYRKRFHRKQLTELDIIEPSRGQLTGDEAHERVAAMFAETVDVKLWEAQRVLQCASTATVDLSGCDALSRALDAAAGEAVATPAGSDSLLIDRVEAEYLRYFTATGRPAKDWKAVTDRVKAAESEVDRCARAVREVDDQVSRHEKLTALVGELGATVIEAGEQLRGARRAQDTVDELVEQLDRARLVAEAAATAHAKAISDASLRRRLVADARSRADNVVGLRTELAAAEESLAREHQAAQIAVQHAEQTDALQIAARACLDEARVAEQVCVARAQAERLAARIERIEAVASDLQQVTGELDSITLTAEMLRDIEQSYTVVDLLKAQLQADSGTVEFTASADTEVTVDGECVVLTTGQTWSRPSAEPVTVDVPGVMTVRVQPGATCARLQADLKAAQALRDEVLNQGAVTDLETAVRIDLRRQTLAERCGTLVATLEGLGAGEDIEHLRAQLADLRGVVGDHDPDMTSDAARAASAAAKQTADAAQKQAQAQRKAADAARAALAEKSTRTMILRDRLNTAEAEVCVAHDQLVLLRAAVSDEALELAVDAAAKEQCSTDGQVAVLAQRYAALDPEAVRIALSAAAQCAESAGRDHAALTLELHSLTVELGVIGSEGRQGQLDEAEVELTRAQAERDRIGQRAIAAQTLRDMMTRHRDTARQRYVRPYRGEVERLGRTVFGPSFEIEVDRELVIRTRTLDGRTVPYESLSGGAREQLGILARLAGAALVAAEDTVPVVIDDALGFSDPDRLTKMGSVFNTVGDRGQVIVLTCQPSRYEGIEGASVIELTA